MSAVRRNSAKQTVLLLAALPLLYLFSYAPYLRMTRGADPDERWLGCQYHRWEDTATEPWLLIDKNLYKPLELLIDNASMDKALRPWSMIWKVEREVLLQKQIEPSNGNLLSSG